MSLRTSSEAPIFFYLALTFLLVLTAYAVVFAFSKKPLKYRDRILESLPLPPGPRGRFEVYPLRLNPFRLAFFFLLMAMSVEILLRYRYFTFGLFFVAAEFAIYIYFLDSYDKSQPRLKSLGITGSELLLEFENAELYPNRLVHIDDLGSHCPYINGRYIGYGDRKPYKPNRTGTGVFGKSGELLFYIPIYMRNYFEIARWIASALPLRHEPDHP